jgi:hypothetical protein
MLYRDDMKNPSEESRVSPFQAMDPMSFDG